MAVMTANLNLTKPELSDNVSPIAFNENFQKIDDAFGVFGTDYVVYQGVQGGWTIRRWKSGIAECWGRAANVKTGAWKWWSKKDDWLQFAGNAISVTYPLTFKQAPLEWATARWSGGDCWLDRSGDNTTTKSSTYYLTTQGDSIKSEGTCVFDIYVVGKWE